LDEKVEVVRAFDINTVANAVYLENFGLKPVTVLEDAFWFTAD
jgi:hypothetical protein